MSPRLSPILRAVALAGALALVVTGCSTADDLANQFKQGSQSYVSGDGTVTEIEPSDRSGPVQFTATTDEGKKISRDSYDGKVVVLNFWYASCPPCRVEAPALETLSKKYAGDGVQFIGVNVRDETDTARAFARTFKLTYPSITDVQKATVQMAVAGQRGPNATPTTIVLDQQGRVASRILGEANEDVLDTLIGDAVKEAK